MGFILFIKILLENNLILLYKMTCRKKIILSQIYNINQFSHHIRSPNRRFFFYGFRCNRHNIYITVEFDINLIDIKNKMIENITST